MNCKQSAEVMCYLKAHNWQKWKSIFPACPWHNILKVQFLWICEILGYFLKINIFFKICLIKVQIWKLFCTHVAHMTVIMFRITILFLPNWFLVTYWFSFPILRFFSVKSSNVLQKFKKEKKEQKLIAFSLPNIG